MSTHVSRHVHGPHVPARRDGAGGQAKNGGGAAKNREGAASVDQVRIPNLTRDCDARDADRVDSETLPPRDELRRYRFMQLIAEHRQVLYKAAMRRCRDRAVADDLVQDACVRAWQNAESLHDESKVLPWLIRILHNVWIDLCRKRSIVVTVADVPDQPVQIEE